MPAMADEVVWVTKRWFRRMERRTFEQVLSQEVVGQRFAWWR